MTVSTVNSTSASAAANAASTAVRTPKHVLDANDFMKLLSVQMQNQDPMKPMDNTEQMAQMAQMSSMQSMAQMSQSVTQMSSNQTLLLANSYLGKQVSLTGADGVAISGQVTAIDGSGPTPLIKVGDSYYALSSITRIEIPAPAVEPAPTP